jgi:hypothetical protein
LASLPRLGCLTSVNFSVSTTPSSPTVNPRKNDELAEGGGSGCWPTAVGSAAQYTMLPAALAEAIWNFTVVAPPLAARTLTLMSCSCTCLERFCQMSFGIIQKGLVV